MSLPKWIEEHFDSYDHEICGNKCPGLRAFSIAAEALENIRNHQKLSMQDSGLSMSMTYIIADKAMRRIEEVGK